MNREKFIAETREELKQEILYLMMKEQRIKEDIRRRTQALDNIKREWDELEKIAEKRIKKI